MTDKIQVLADVADIRHGATVNTCLHRAGTLWRAIAEAFNATLAGLLA